MKEKYGDTCWKRWRKENGWSQSEVAFRSKLSLNGYQNIERGISKPKPETLEKMELVFEQNIEKHPVKGRE